MVPVLAMFFAFQGELRQSLNGVELTSQTLRLAKLTYVFSSLVHELQKEHGASVGYLGGKIDNFSVTLRTQHTLTDTRLNDVRSHLKQIDASDYGVEFSKKLDVIVTKLWLLDQTRQSILRRELITEDVDRYYVDTLNENVSDLIGFLLPLSQSGQESVRAAAYIAFIEGKALASIERAMLVAVFQNNGFKEEMFEQYLALLSAQDVFLKQFMGLASNEQVRAYIATVVGTEVEEAISLSHLAKLNGRDGGFNVQAMNWFDLQSQKIEMINKVERKLANDILTAAEESVERASARLTTIVLLSLFTILMVMLIAAQLTRSILAQVGGDPVRIKDVADKISAGDLSVDLKGEVGILGSIGNIVNTLNDAAHYADIIATGDYTVDIEPKNDADILGMALLRMTAVLRDVSLVADNLAKGDLSLLIEQQSDKDLLAISFNKMVMKLRETTEENAKQLWISVGVTGAYDAVRGEVNLNKMAQSLCQYLARYLQVQVMTFYAAEEKGLNLVGQYAVDKITSQRKKIEIGEGFVGQAAVEKKLILVEEVPNDYLQITSSVGSVHPKNLVIIPFVVEGVVFGVIEIGSFEIFSKEKIKLLGLLEESIGIRIRSIHEQDRANNLHEETQRQSEELRDINISLNEQTLLLKKSEEELKQQSRELQISNDDLEEKQATLRQQKSLLEQSKDELELRAEEITNASKYKSEFLANMSHELRTPLNSLLILSKSLADNKQGNLTDVQQQDACVVYEGGQELLTLINDIMDLSKVEAGMLTLVNEQVSLALMLRNLQDLFDRGAVEKGIELIIENDTSLPLTIQSDGQRLAQVLRNFLSNAFKFTSKGKVTIKVHRPDANVRFSDTDLDVNTVLAFSVIDTGIGIPVNKQKAIFEAFQQQDGSTSRKYGGTGLGLTISRELAKLLGGEIQLQSIEGEGSTFTLYLPRDGLASANSVSLVKVPNRIENKSQWNKTELDLGTSVVETSAANDNEIEVVEDEDVYVADDRRNTVSEDNSILIIEDNREFARVLLSIVQDNGYKGLVTSLGREGLYLAMQHHPTGILLDTGLPDIDGLDVLEQLKYHVSTHNIPVHVISGSDVKQLSMDMGATGFVTKPVSEEKIVELLLELSRLSALTTKTVLVIEDNRANQRSIERLLAAEEVRVIVASTGGEAIAHLSKSSVDCIILDLGLPDMSGHDLLKNLKGDDRTNTIPVIVYTGETLSDEQMRNVEELSDDVVIKGSESPERLVENISFFTRKTPEKLTSEQRQQVLLAQDENVMLKKRKILLVDDDMRNVFALSRQLTDLDMDVVMADNGQVALDKIGSAKVPFELILMDIMMPVMDGYEAISRIRKLPKYKETPILTLTAKAMPGDRVKCMDVGASEYLTKPIDMERLLALLRVWLYRKPDNSKKEAQS